MLLQLAANPCHLPVTRLYSILPTLPAHRGHRFPAMLYLPTSSASLAAWAHYRPSVDMLKGLLACKSDSGRRGVRQAYSFKPWSLPARPAPASL